MRTRKPIIENHILLIILGVSIALLGFFFLNYHVFQLDSVLLGVIQNLLTIPCMLGLVAVVICGFINWKSTSFSLNSKTMVVFLVGLLATIVLFYSF